MRPGAGTHLFLWVCVGLVAAFAAWVHFGRLDVVSVADGEVIPAWTGIFVQDLDPRLASYLGVPDVAGAMVTEIEAGSPAAGAGLLDGDIILSVAGKKVNAAATFEGIMKGYAAGDTVRLSLLRGGRNLSVSLKTGAYPAERGPELAMRLLGIAVETRGGGRQLRNTGRKEGVVISRILRKSRLARIGVRPGDIIRRIDDVPVGSVDEFHRTLVKFRRKSSLVVLVQRGNRGYYITVDL